MDTATSTSGPVHYVNIEYFFRLIYDLFSGHHTFQISSFFLFFIHLWMFITVLALALCAFAFYVFVYTGVRIKQVRDAEVQRYGTIAPEEAEEHVEHSRWTYIMQLIESGQESDWRNAIIEADIMLDDMLTRIGLPGATVGDKLKAASPDHFRTLQDAWEAHKVRNDIAHQGSGFQLTDHIAYQTIQRYRNVFEEFHEI